MRTCVIRILGIVVASVFDSVVLNRRASNYSGDNNTGGMAALCLKYIYLYTVILAHVRHSLEMIAIND